MKPIRPQVVIVPGLRKAARVCAVTVVYGMFEAPANIGLLSTTATRYKVGVVLDGAYLKPMPAAVEPATANR
jgi:hypothetical protein